MKETRHEADKLNPELLNRAHRLVSFFPDSVRSVDLIRSVSSSVLKAFKYLKCVEPVRYFQAAVS